MTLSRNALVILAVAAIAATSITPSFAKPNNHAYAKSAEAFKKQQSEIFCAGMKDNLLSAELNADGLAGTKAAAKWAKIADGIWSDAHDAGCSWAA